MLSIFAFVTVLIIMSSAVFRVRHIEAYGINIEGVDIELNRRVIDTAPIRRGQSIFSVRDRSVTTELHNEIPNIRVVNVERIFPNRVSINFLKRFEHFEIYHSGRYFVMDETLHILRYAPSSNSNLIRLGLADNTLAGTLNIGQPLLASGSQEMAITREIAETTYRIDFNHTAITFFEYISFANPNNIILLTRYGVRVRLEGRTNIETQLRSAISIFNSTNYSNRRHGIIYQLANGNWLWTTYTT